MEKGNTKLMKGKTLKDFEQWFRKQEYYDKRFVIDQIIDGKITPFFLNQLPESMQWGVKVDFFYEQKIDLDKLLMACHKTPFDMPTGNKHKSRISK